MNDAVKLRGFAATITALALATGCDEPGSLEPGALPSSTPNAQVTAVGGATLAVDVASTGSANYMGSDIDPDGYTAWVDFSASQDVGANGLVTFSGLAAGEHVVALYGIASNCTVYTIDRGSNNPRLVSLVGGVAGSTDFSVGCGPWGGLTVWTKTTGVDLPDGGYAITLNGGASQAIAPNGSVTFTDLYEGTYSIRISGVEGNCTLSGTNPRLVTVSPGATSSATFSASCVPTGSGSGSLTVTANTTGSTIDPDGYTVTIDGSISQAIGATNGSVTVAGPAGDHRVELSGVASNCTVGGANPRTVSVPAGGAATTAFSITCSAPVASVVGQGQLGMGTAAPYRNVQTFNLDLRADLTGRFTFSDYSNIHPPDIVATLTTDTSADPATSVTAYRDRSDACADPSRGMEFDAIGREYEGILVSYTVQICDNGPAGGGTDFLSFWLPAERYGRSGIATSGDLAKR